MIIETQNQDNVVTSSGSGPAKQIVLSGHKQKRSRGRGGVISFIFSVCAPS